MSVQRFKSLLFKSTVIQEEIQLEQSRRWPDWLRLLKLKKLRLAIKDRLLKLMAMEGVTKLQPVKVRARRAKRYSQ